ncbi:ParA family protein [Schinkia azotoformans]|nr:ParA family protein [Schinkia azotoformans]
MKIYSFYNNKGGVGKTTLSQNAVSLYAKNNPTTQVLVLDLCPQSNISQFLLGGGHKGYINNQRLQQQSSRRNIVGFIDWLLKGNSSFTSLNQSYKINVSKINMDIPSNVYLIAGDPFLESLSLALNYAVINPANINAWQEYMTAIRRLCELEFNSEKYEELTVFIDCNPSFSIYTQMALVSSDYLIIPMMADFSSIEGIKGIMMLLYDKYPSAAIKNYAQNVITFNKQIQQFGLSLPKMYGFVFNNFTPNDGIAAAFGSIRSELIDFCYQQFLSFPNLFKKNTNSNTKIDWAREFVSDVKDFHTAGKVSTSLGIPLTELTQKTKYTMPDMTEITLPRSNYAQSVTDINKFVSKIQ